MRETTAAYPKNSAARWHGTSCAMIDRARQNPPEPTAAKRT
jgi:hypothetical protein